MARSRNFGYMRIALFCCLFIAGIAAAFSQEGKVVYHGTERIDLKIESLSSRIDTTEMEGYRIQLFFGTDMNNAEEVKARFASLYPEWTRQIYMPYTQPYWRVRVGNFYSQLEAQPMLKQLAADFGNVFLVKDKIVRPPLPETRF
ncbi:MAG: SPOR domain-containing protein [Flavobacteriales bacterium]|nr:SPOR domain-containing protein [Flavobacteriales bacterium]